MTKKRIILTIIFLVLTCAWIAFIWINSATPGDESKATSDTITETFNSFLPFSVSTLFIRKTGHVLEYAILSVLICFLIKYFYKISRNSNISDMVSLFHASLVYSLLVAALDEAIQTKTPGRVGCVTDVMIDFAGAVVASGIFLIVMIILRKRKIKKLDKGLLTGRHIL